MRRANTDVRVGNCGEGPEASADDSSELKAAADRLASALAEDAPENGPPRNRAALTVRSGKTGLISSIDKPADEEELVNEFKALRHRVKGASR
jgi:hypothetical protein